MIPSIIVLASVIFGAGAGYYIENKSVQKDLKTARLNALRIKQENEQKAHEIEKNITDTGKKKAEAYRDEELDELTEQVTENQTRENRVNRREESLTAANDRLDKVEKSIIAKRKNNESIKDEIAQETKMVVQLHRKRKEILSEKGQITVEQSKQLVLTALETNLKKDQDNLIKSNHDAQLLTASKDASNLMVESLQQGPVNVPRSRIERSLDIADAGQRSKILGKNEQRLRLIESLTGVDLIFDPENPTNLIISTSDPTRREIARRSIVSLLAHKNLTNNSIANEIADVQAKVMSEFRETGENTVSYLRLGWVHPDLMKVLGRLKYRTSYGQNVLQHSIEVAQISGVLAAELGLNVTLAKRAGLFHDIGKAIDREVNGTHVELGIKLTEAYGEDPVVVNSIASHHGDVEPDNPIAILVAVADGMSGARPGARSESVEEYINRLKNLEKIANDQPGVKTSYAIQAGREIRIIVDPEKVNDEQSSELTDKVANEIEEELTYPGKIKVTTIRRLQAVQYVGGKPKKIVKKKKNA